MVMSTRERPDWNEYFLSISRAVAARADCTRRKAGAVLVKNNRIVSCGYNGSPAGEPGCLTDNSCPRGAADFAAVAPYSSYDSGPGACIAVHAEANALLYADRDRTEGAILYTTPGDPCEGCFKLIKGSGVTSVYTPAGLFWSR